ncbi:MAG: helix-turn-helix domain-containing protein [Chloroflexi bacterium]|nr:helix-turn-helix domain-containing protein [Chloroflexota bacterium]
MARKATVDVDGVLEMLREGQSTQAVAEHFGVSRQAIDLHRRRFIQSGQLGDRRATRQAAVPQAAPRPPVTSAGGPSEHEKPAEKEAPAAKLPQEVSLDRLIELVIEAFGSLKKLPKLEAELEQYRQDYQKAAGRIELLEKEANKRREQEARWQQVMGSDARHSPGG